MLGSTGLVGQPMPEHDLRKMRIIHYQPQFLGRDSGTVNAGRGWAAAMARAGSDVLALVDNSTAERPPPDGVDVAGLDHSLRGAVRLPRDVSRAIGGADIVVLHGGWYLGNVVVGRACLRQGVPFVITTHGAYASEVFETRVATKRIWAATLERPHLRRALAVHVFFPEQTSQVERLCVDLPSIVAPNGISVPETARWDGGSGGYLLWLGRFHPVQKGLDLIVKAVAGMPADRRPEVRLHGPDWRGQKARVRALVRELDVEPWIRIGEPIYGDEKWELIARAAGCVFPSRSDACPVAVSEAAALGVPTLVAGYPLGDFLATQRAAVRVEHEPSSVADGIAFLTSPEARELGARASSVAREWLSWDAVTKSWVAQLKRLVGRELDPPSWTPQH
jgi:glycosyltransferase involved in cell wall biosynthesis